MGGDVGEATRGRGIDGGRGGISVTGRCDLVDARFLGVDEVGRDLVPSFAAASLGIEGVRGGISMTCRCDLG